MWESHATGVVFACVLCARGYAKGSLSRSGVVAAFFTGWITVAVGGLPPTVDLVVFFLTASALTRMGAGTKAAREAEYASSSSRTAVQVLANSAGATGALVLGSLAATPASYAWANIAVLAHYASCAADTWASEVGILAQARPRLITAPWRTVPHGTNGGVTLSGTLAAAAAGLCVGLAHGLAVLVAHPPPAPAIAVLGGYMGLGLVIGLLGTSVDSVLGATLQFSGWDPQRAVVVEVPGPGVAHICGRHVLDNHQVNALAAALSLAASLYVAPWFVAV